MLAREVVIAAMNDIGTFFYKEAEFNIDYELDCSGDMTASVKCIFENPVVCFSTRFCNEEVDSIERFLFILFVVSHELAHFISLHHLHQDVDKLDSISIESRADFFGAQVALSLVSFGNSIQQLVQNSESSLSFEIKPESVLNAVIELNNTLFVKNVSDNYPSSQYRTMSIIAGCISFFSIYAKEHKTDLDQGFIRELFSGNYLKEVPLINDHKATIGAISNRLNNIHKILQLNNPMSVAGIKFEYAQYLSTVYTYPEEFAKKQMQYNEKQYGELFKKVISIAPESRVRSRTFFEHARAI